MQIRSSFLICFLNQYLCSTTKKICLNVLFFFLKKKNQKEKSSLSTDIICRVRIIIDQFLLNSRLWLDGGGKIYSTIKMLLIINYVLLMCDIMYNSCETKSKTRYFALELGTNFQQFSLMYRKEKKDTRTHIYTRKKKLFRRIFFFQW